MSDVPSPAPGLQLHHTQGCGGPFITACSYDFSFVIKSTSVSHTVALGDIQETQLTAVYFVSIPLTYTYTCLETLQTDLLPVTKNAEKRQLH